MRPAVSAKQALMVGFEPSQNHSLIVAPVLTLSSTTTFETTLANTATINELMTMELLPSNGCQSKTCAIEMTASAPINVVGSNSYPN